MTISIQSSLSSWPFPVIGQFRLSPGSGEKMDHDTTPDEEQPDLVEKELVEEQLERDRKASKAVDSNLKSKDRH